MNDKPSVKPPSVFLREEKELERHFDAREGEEGIYRGVSGGIADAGAIARQQAGIFRFGYAIANVFKGMWGGSRTETGGPAKQNNEGIPPCERKAKAEKKYQELKSTGFALKTAKTDEVEEPLVDAENHGADVYHRGGAKENDDDEWVPVKKDYLINECSAAVLKDTRDFSVTTTDTVVKHDRDSGIDMELDSARQSTDNGSNLFDSNIPILEPTLRSSQDSRSPSPGCLSETSSRSALSSLRLHRPSMKSLKNATSHFSLRGPQRGISSQQKGQPDVLNSMRSQKDLKRAAHLAKKVSNLEEQLGKARRDYMGSLGLGALPMPSTAAAAPTMHKPFIPGALPTLPSERLLVPAPETQASLGPVIDSSTRRNRRTSPRSVEAAEPEPKMPPPDLPRGILKNKLAQMTAMNSPHRVSKGRASKSPTSTGTANRSSSVKRKLAEKGLESLLSEQDDVPIVASPNKSKQIPPVPIVPGYLRGKRAVITEQDMLDAEYGLKVDAMNENKTQDVGYINDNGKFVWPEDVF